MRTARARFAVSADARQFGRRERDGARPILTGGGAGLAYSIVKDQSAAKCWPLASIFCGATKQVLFVCDYEPPVFPSGWHTRSVQGSKKRAKRLRKGVDSALRICLVHVFPKLHIDLAPSITGQPQ